MGFAGMFRLLFLLLSILDLCMINLPAEQVISFAEFGGVVQKRVLINSSDFNAEELKPIANRILRSDPGRRVSKIALGVDLFEGPSFITPRQGFHWPFELWIHLFRTLSPPMDAYAEVWKLSSGTGLALRNRSGRIDHTVITGSNPFEMRWKDLDLKILYLAVHQPGRGVKGRGPSPAVRVFVESPRTLSSIEAVGVTKEVKAKIGLQNIEVVLADNPWFTDDVYYPVYNRLAAYPSNLPGEQYLKSIKWFCETDCLKMLPTR
jgi:hypothetical protein